jgi:hypothetical protein
VVCIGTMVWTALIFTRHILLCTHSFLFRDKQKYKQNFVKGTAQNFMQYVQTRESVKMHVSTRNMQLLGHVTVMALDLLASATSTADELSALNLCSKECDSTYNVIRLIIMGGKCSFFFLVPVLNLALH